MVEAAGTAPASITAIRSLRITTMHISYTQILSDASLCFLPAQISLSVFPFGGIRSEGVRRLAAGKHVFNHGPEADLRQDKAKLLEMRLRELRCAFIELDEGLKDTWRAVALHLIALKATDAAVRHASKGKLVTSDEAGDVVVLGALLLRIGQIAIATGREDLIAAVFAMRFREEVLHFEGTRNNMPS